MDETNRVALITGGGTGIGAAAAYQFAKQEVAVAIVGRRADVLEDIVAKIRVAGGAALAIQGDLANTSSPNKRNYLQP